MREVYRSVILPLVRQNRVKLCTFRIHSSLSLIYKIIAIVQNSLFNIEVREKIHVEYHLLDYL